MMDSMKPESAVANTNDTPKDYKIGLWGTVGSGKSHYIAMLYNDVRGRAPTFRIEELTDERQFREADRPVMRASKMAQTITRDRQWIPRTPPDPQHVMTYVFRILRTLQEHKGFLGRDITTVRHSILLTFTDAGGEWYRNPDEMLESYGDQFKEGKLNPIDLLAQCDGLICLLDTRVAMGYSPEGSHESPIATSAADRAMGPVTSSEFEGDFQGLARILKSRGDQHGTIKQAIAICLSKVDQPGLWERRDSSKDLQDWARHYMPYGAIEEIYNQCDEERVRWFGVSAIGVTQNNAGEYESVAKEDYSGIRTDVQTIRPYGLYKPVGWLASTITGANHWEID